MGQVIALGKTQQIDEELLETLEEIIAFARRGKAKGLSLALDMDDGTQRIITRGTLARDPGRLVCVVATALDAFCRKTGITHPKVSLDNGLPRRLRA